MLTKLFSILKTSGNFNHEGRPGKLGGSLPQGKCIRCTQATLEALGIPGKSPKTGLGVVQEISKAGHKYRVLHDKSTVRKFVKEHPKGKYYFWTSGHAMALVDGKLTDTMEEGLNLRRVMGGNRDSNVVACNRS